jgi:hypothetical protein
MLHYFKFRQELLDPLPGRETYHRREPGRGWPEQCPPIRAANAFGFDLPANFDITFTRRRGRWHAEPDVVIDSDFNYAGTESSEGAPLRQQFAWFWEKGQKLPHVISDNVYAAIRNQVKLSTFLFLKTDPNELILMTDPPGPARPWRAMTALIDTDWYPASYPWHCVLELDPKQSSISIRRGEPICRIIPVRRDTYFAGPMSPGEFDEFFARGQRWLAENGSIHQGGTVDITGTYGRHQPRSRFVVMD